MNIFEGGQMQASVSLLWRNFAFDPKKRIGENGLLQDEGTFLSAFFGNPKKQSDLQRSLG
jgi:hypothetical protein